MGDLIFSKAHLPLHSVFFLFFLNFNVSCYSTIIYLKNFVIMHLGWQNLCNVVYCAYLWSERS